MVKKSDLALLGIGLIVLVSASKQIGSFFGQVGSSVGSSLSTGLQDFVSSLNPFSGQGATNPSSAPAGSGPAMMSGADMMLPNMMMSSMMGGENLGQAIIGGAGTVAGQQAISKGAADMFLSPTMGETPITTDTLTNLFSMLTSKIPNIETDIPSIGGYLQQFLQKGGSSIEDFAANFKFPSGYTLNEILGASGAGKSLTPDAAGLTMGIYAYQNLMNPSYVNLLESEGIDVSGLMSGKYSGMGPKPVNDLTTIMTHVTPPPSNIPLSMMNLNADGKVTTAMGSYGKIQVPGAVYETYQAPGSQGLGNASILPPNTLTEVLKANPGFTASQAADYLARTMMSLPSGFDFGTNEGSGLISMFDVTGKKVVSSMVNPVELAYEAYKAMYGLM